MKTSFKHIVLLCALVLPTPFVAQEQEIEIVETTNVWGTERKVHC